MMVLLAEYLSSLNNNFNVIYYSTLRGILASLTALLFSLFLGPFFIRKLSGENLGQPVRELGPDSHLSKSGTPTMGGILILSSIIFSTLLWADLNNRFIWIALSTTIFFSIIGFIDDYKKLLFNNSKGLSASQKFVLQSLLAIISTSIIYILSESPNVERSLLIPYLKSVSIPLGFIAYVIFSSLVIVGTSNAVNLTDGLDGLAIMPSVMIISALGVFAYATGNINFSFYLDIPYIPGTGELLIFCAALAGSGLGFLWFNTYPAQVFMGDIGALGIGAAIGIVAVMVRQELILFIMGGLFVIETLSVIVQVLSFKITGKRIFKMAPLHHHYELKGWAEPKVIVRFWIITVILVLIGLASLKIR